MSRVNGGVAQSIALPTTWIWLVVAKIWLVDQEHNHVDRLADYHLLSRSLKHAKLFLKRSVVFFLCDPQKSYLSLHLRSKCRNLYEPSDSYLLSYRECDHWCLGTRQFQKETQKKSWLRLRMEVLFFKGITTEIKRTRKSILIRHKSPYLSIIIGTTKIEIGSLGWNMSCFFFW